MWYVYHRCDAIFGDVHFGVIGPSSESRVVKHVLDAHKRNNKSGIEPLMTCQPNTFLRQGISLRICEQAHC